MVTKGKPNEVECEQQVLINQLHTLEAKVLTANLALPKQFKMKLEASLSQTRFININIYFRY